MIVDWETRVLRLKGKASADSMRDLYFHAYNPRRNEGFFAGQDHPCRKSFLHWEAGSQTNRRHFFWRTAWRASKGNGKQICEENCPRLEPRIRLEDPVKSYHAKYRVKAGKVLTAENAKSKENTGSLRLNEPGDLFDTLYWQRGHSTERGFIYVTTQHLNADQLAQLSDEVGDAGGGELVSRSGDCGRGAEGQSAC